MRFCDRCKSTTLVSINTLDLNRVYDYDLEKQGLEKSKSLQNSSKIDLCDKCSKYLCSSLGQIISSYKFEEGVWNLPNNNVTLEEHLKRLKEKEIIK